MHHNEKRLASAKCEPPKNDLAGALIGPENTGSVTASQAPLREPITVVLAFTMTVATSSRVSANSSATSCAIRPPADVPQSDWLRAISARLKGRAYERD